LYATAQATGPPAMSASGGTKRTYRDVCYLVAFGGQSGHQPAIAEQTQFMSTRPRTIFRDGSRASSSAINAGLSISAMPPIATEIVWRGKGHDGPLAEVQPHLPCGFRAARGIVIDTDHVHVPGRPWSNILRDGSTKPQRTRITTSCSPRRSSKRSRRIRRSPTANTSSFPTLLQGSSGTRSYGR
jgi:hypothetical protein